jgi:citrate lyase subunit beta / citryl-CoA lyase
MTSRLIRTALYVPASNEKAVAKADSLNADAIIFDLEDSVAPDSKVAARERLFKLPPPLRFRVVRVNGSTMPWHDEDIVTAVQAYPAALLLPKANTPEDIWAFKRLIALQRPKSNIAIWAMVETPMGVLNAPAIASALGPDGALVMGLNDLAKESGMQQLPGRTPMLSALASTVMAARAYGAAVFDGVYNALTDPEGFAAECQQGRSFGFDGKTVIHPNQIGPANTIFGPSETEIIEAKAIVEAFALPENTDKGVIAMGARMVERLHLDMAHSVLKRALMIARKGNN